MHKAILAMASAVALSACTANYPNLATADRPPAADPNNPEELDYILYEAVKLQQSYDTGYKKTAQWQDYSQLPIIGAAGYAAWVLLNNKANAATKAGKIGIGASVYSEARGQLTSPGLTDAYIAGHGALTCVLAEGSMFAGKPAHDRYQALDILLGRVTAQIELVNSVKSQVPSDANQHADALKIARTLADQAIAAARTAEMAALLQEGAFQSAAPTFRNAVSSISVRVASKGRVRPAMDFATLRDRFAPPKPTPDVVRSESGPPRSLELIQDLNDKIGRLASLTAQLTGTTPSYTQSLARVSACPDLVK